jgi:hypothetical protein
MEPLQTGNVVATLIAQMSARAGFDLLPLVTSVDYRPPAGRDLALRLTPDAPQFATDLACVRGADRTGVFLNLQLGPSLSDLRTPPPIAQSLRIAVEHTSLVPVYPLNLATFRSSVLGEWLCRSLELLGHSVHPHHWVQDTARQLELVERTLGPRGSAKADHVVGFQFTCALHRAGPLASDVGEEARHMFPLSRPTSGISASMGLGEDLVAEVCAAWDATFVASGVASPRFDIDSRVLGQMADGVLHDVREAIRRSDANMTPREAGSSASYLDRNVLYYRHLLDDHDRVFSVVSERQRSLAESAKAAALHLTGRTEDSLEIRTFGDVLVDGALDSIRDLRFHSVDQILSDAESLGYSKAAARHALISKFLGVRSHTTVHFKGAQMLDNAHDPHVARNQDPVVTAVLLEDELPLLLNRAVESGTFASLQRWLAEVEHFLSDGSLGGQSDVGDSLRRSAEVLSAR